MKRLIIYTLSLFFYWILVFFLLRIFFVLYQLPIGSKIKKSSDLYAAFIEGYQIDLSTSAILLLLPLLAAILFYILGKEGLKKWASRLVFIMLLVYTAVALSDAGLYREWNAKINMQALDHFKNPAEVFRTLSFKLVAIYFLLLGGFSMVCFWIYKKWIHPVLNSNEEISLKERLGYGLGYFLFSTGIAIIVIRGGLFNMPINQSIAYFSNDILANDIAVNPLYNLIQDLDIKGKIPDSTVYKFRTNEDAKALIAEDFKPTKDTSVHILNNPRPNLVFMFLESWSNDNIGILGGLKDCTPQFDKLCEDGLLFTNAYANAYVSDQGIPAVLSAYPSVSRMAITNQPSKVHNLPCISEDLLPLGYSSSFLFGGELVYGNLRGYLLEKKFTDLVEVYDMRQYPAGSLGVQDEHTLLELMQRLGKKKSPFLYGYFSQSTHMPYDFKPSDDYRAAADNPEKKYTESVHYADIHIGRFFEQVKKQEWYKNTLFIIVADHSHNTHAQWDPSNSLHHKIPLLLLGGALRPEWKGQQWDNIVSQLDVVGGLLSQMGLDRSRYPWSRDMFNPTLPNAAYYVFYGGVGRVTPEGYASYSQSNRHHIYSNLTDTNLQRKYYNKATSFQQLVYEDVRTRK
jgi:phosphoglycerol transferase MdoB-like AlkP superfamily enzyme